MTDKEPFDLWWEFIFGTPGGARWRSHPPPGRVGSEKGKIVRMPKLRRYVEWMNLGRRTDRVAYVIKEWDMPKPLPGAEWQLDTKFNVADALLRAPGLKSVLKAAFENGAEVVTQKHSWGE
jgi:hypothetical protein